MNRVSFNDLKIGKKLGVCLTIIGVLAFIAGGACLRNLRYTGYLTTDFVEGPYEVTNNAMSIRRDIVSTDQNMGYAIIEGSMDAYESTIKENFESLDKSISVIANNINNDNKNIENIKTFVNEYKNECNNISQIIKFGNIEEAKALLLAENGAYYTAYSKVVDGALKLYEDARTNGNQSHQNIKDRVRSGWALTTAVGSFTILVIIITSRILTKRLNKPIKQIEIAANKMSKGDFDIEINYESKDELGSLSDSMRQMSKNTNNIIKDTVKVLGNIASGNFDTKPKVEYMGIFENIEKSVNKITKDLSETMSQINLASEEVGLASEQVSSASQMLAQGTTEQANAIEELSSTIMEISHKINDTSTNAKEANELSLSAGHEVEAGNNKMKEMIKAMDEISLSSKEIGRIIKTIDDIAFQTNILALNAAVEAARAGESGKGFAVVADEVRNLSAKSAEAAKNTANLIENSIKSVKNGENIVVDTAKSLEKIMDMGMKTGLLVNKIAKASEEQSIAVNQVTIGVEQISQVVQTNSATAEESAASSEELSGQAAGLKGLIENFRLKQNNSNSKARNNKKEFSFFSKEEDDQNLAMNID